MKINIEKLLAAFSEAPETDGLQKTKVSDYVLRHIYKPLSQGEKVFFSSLDFSRFDEEDLRALENWIGERTNMRRNFYRLNTIFDLAAPISSAKRAYC